MSEMSFKMEIPTDAEGFGARGCPGCEREFKWILAGEGDEATPAEPGGYYCPYCAHQASADEWFTKEQLEKAEALLANEVLRPELEQMSRRFDRSGHIKLKVDPPAPVPELVETGDGRRVEFACHPNDPVKVDDDWPGAVHCGLCGQTAG